MNPFRSLLVVGLSLCLLASAIANDNVRAVQAKLKEGGYFFGEVDGAFSSDLSAAITRYQIRNGLQVTGQLDEETGKALGAAPAVVATTTTTTTSTTETAPTSETWRRLRKTDQEFLTRLNAQQPLQSSPGASAAPAVSAEATPPAQGRATAPSTTAAPNDNARLTLSTERLRDYVGAFVLAGLDPQVGAELEFFADRVRYYDEGTIDREKIRRSLETYNEMWPARRFWIAGELTAEPQENGRFRVTFPLRYELRNGGKRSSGEVRKSLLLEVAGDDLEIVAVNETRAR